MALKQISTLRILAGALAIAMLVATFVTVGGIVQGRLAQQAASSAALRVQALESTLAKQRAVAAILSDDRTLHTALATRSPAALRDVSSKLDRLREETESAVIYILNVDGIAVAASNYDELVSFVGIDYSFREYYADALQTGKALQYALGSVSKRPGLYLSNRVDGVAGPIGVVVVKVEFVGVESSWARSPDKTYVTRADGQVVLSDSDQARFKPAPPLPWGYRSVTEPVPGAGWTLELRYTTYSARVTATLATLVSAALMLMLALALGRAARQRHRREERAAREAQYRNDLERAVDKRTRDLSDAMRERQAAEQRLAAMQADLVQANKLATLGQVTAGVAHEVNQPLATIRLLAENATAMLPADASDDLEGNLARIVQMTDRISQITTELRSFSRKASGRLEPVRIQDVIDASLLLTASRRRVEGARLIREPFDPNLRAMAEAVRLEQVLVNLIQNAQEVLAGRPDPEIRIAVRQIGDKVELSVSDNGPGLTPETWATLFIPFTTSKTYGLGLGLVIAQGIARDFGGDLLADPPLPGKGATFRTILKGAA